ncbi:hypothetical protein [Catenuloplanes atrovinosus]|uniref:hypothetical protein n=1 Tax=Catenuloplanes atrovinosus TaxID=137266 RepID=UPI00286BEF1D|nr:hypothetical protein [Catenuloplanes atrovinosus]
MALVAIVAVAGSVMLTSAAAHAAPESVATSTWPPAVGQYVSTVLSDPSANSPLHPLTLTAEEDGTIQWTAGCASSEIRGELTADHRLMLTFLSGGGFNPVRCPSPIRSEGWLMYVMLSEPNVLVSDSELRFRADDLEAHFVRVPS